MKRCFAIFITACFCLCLLSSCGEGEGDTTEPSYTTRPPETMETLETTETGETVAPPSSSFYGADWEYRSIDLSDGQYRPSSFDADVAAAAFGYEEGTYEYDYFRALSGISANAYLVGVDHSVICGIDLVDKFTERIDMTAYIAPYESILYHTFSLLADRGFTLPDISSGSSYIQSIPYELHAAERSTVLGLFFNYIDTALIEYAEELLALSARYPAYEGEFALSEKAIEEAEALVEACRPIAENRDTLRASWRAYYQEVAPTLEVTEEFIAELDAVKITISGNGQYYLPNVKGEYIENYQYRLESSISRPGVMVDRPVPMDSPVVIYLPVSSYCGMGFDRQLSVTSMDESGYPYENTVALTLDPADYFSDEPLTMNDPFLDAALREYFGGDYSERDLLNIVSLTISYWLINSYGPNEPYIMFSANNEEDRRIHTYYYYSEFFDEPSDGCMPETIEEDVRHFHGLTVIVLGDQNGYRIPEELEQELMPYEVTENIWDS